MPDLANKTARKKLKPRSSAYTQKLAEGRALGYRKRTPGQPGRWLLRTARFPSGYDFETLGTADDVAEADGREVLSYSQALTAALGRSSADPNRIRVADAMDAWAHYKCQEASTEKRKLDLESQARRIAVEFGHTTLNNLTVRAIGQWMEKTVAQGSDPRARRATANKNLAILKAALTRVADEADYQGPRAWVSAKKFAKAEAFGKRMVILTPDEEERLIAVARPDMADLLRALQMTGARYGEIRDASVGDLQGKRLTLSGKTGPRTIALDDEKADWFRKKAGNRTESEPLILRQDGQRWPDGGQRKPMMAAVEKAGLPCEVTTYALRHGFISRALSRGVPTLAVAQHVGSSVAMIEASYGKFAVADFEAWFS